MGAREIEVCPGFSRFLNFDSEFCKWLIVRQFYTNSNEERRGIRMSYNLKWKEWCQVHDEDKRCPLTSSSLMPLSRTNYGVIFSLFCGLSSIAPAAAPQQAAIPNRAPLQQNAFYPLPLGAVKPQGWLKDQLRIQASGLTGHLDEFWNDVGSNSAWLGGTGEAWERGPYYLDGLLPLAYQLDDAQLKAKAGKWVNWSLTHQQSNGQFGPPQNDDWWPRMVMLKVLTQYQEVSGDGRVVPFMTRYFHYELENLPRKPLRDWGRYRWQDNLLSVLWLYNRTGDKTLLQLAELLHEQGYDWRAQFTDFKYTGKQTKAILGLKHEGAPPDAAMQTHGVNNAMAIKTSPLWWLVKGDAGDRIAIDQQIALLDKYHGLPNGMFSGDEHLAGTDPSQGIELCAVVEAMFSFEEALAVLGDTRLADRLERVAYNALPATLSNDMWSHQYDQQPNQIACDRAHRQWSTNGDDSNLFGLEPNFGCCTANLHQGWPKFITSLWMGSADGGLFTSSYGPSEVHSTIHGRSVAVEEKTNYPFDGKLEFTVHLDQAQKFPITFRLPAWAQAVTASLNGKPFRSWKSSSDPQSMLMRIDRDWRDGDQISFTLPMEPRVSHWFHQAAVFERGPLVFALPLDAKWSELKTYAGKSSDWQLLPTEKWNYAVELGPCEAKTSERPVTATPFDVQNPPVVMTVRGRLLPEWTVSEHSAGAVPESPVKGSGALQSLTLVPYGAAKLRITAFPFLSEQAECGPASASAR